ncbi:hypothetical protein GEV33_006178 [Tenebrio molitor]|uniref:Tyrosine-protein phosphatase domain-containing protein n=1 Tax=Tenebrio molitor TaxID=7067 RepID=A0A8J6HLS5_TENMO|nr:hypothetical protein GEV33_006178 [Tenebrio molitor]
MLSPGKGDHHRTTCRTGSRNLPAGSDFDRDRDLRRTQPGQGRIAAMVKYDHGRNPATPPNRSTPGELLPAPTLAAAVLLQKRKTAEVKQYKEDTKNVQKNECSSLSHWKVGDEDPPFGAGLWRRFLGEWGRRPSDQGKNLSALGDGDNHYVAFFIKGPPNPPSVLGVGPHRTPTYFWDPITSSHLHTGTARPPLTPQSSSSLLRRWITSCCGIEAKTHSNSYRRSGKCRSTYPLRTHSPIFICSGGSVKMTGFILLCDMCLRTAEKDGVVDVLKNLKQLSTYATDLVCDVEQYKLAHRVVSEDGTEIFHDLLPVVLSVPGESQGDSDRVNLQGRRDDVVEFTRAVGDDSSKYHRPHRQADHGLHYGRFQTERFCGSGSRRVLSVQVVPGLTGRCRIYPPASQEQW